MTKPLFNTKYITGPLGVSDWVAGGNFDGYIFSKSLIFHEPNIVSLEIEILDQSRYDGNRNNSIEQGTFEFTDKDTITIELNGNQFRCKILGTERDYIVLTMSESTEVYQADKS